VAQFDDLARDLLIQLEKSTKTLYFSPFLVLEYPMPTESVIQGYSSLTLKTAYTYLYIRRRFLFIPGPYERSFTL
jgi:hypothetical protein